MTDELEEPLALVTDVVGDRAGEWDRGGRLPEEEVRWLGAKGLLCAQIPPEFGGRGFSSEENGRLTAHTGRLCSSLRSLMTSQGMAAWTVERFGSGAQQAGISLSSPPGA